MKLTKGKLSKILNKKKQNMKKYKNKISNEKNKTYKNKKGLNLHNSTIKNIF